MLRKTIVRQLRETASAAGELKGVRLENGDADGRIEMEPELVGHLVASSLSYAALVVNGDIKAADPSDAVAVIVATAFSMLLGESRSDGAHG